MQGRRGGVSEVEFVQWVGWLGVRDANQVPLPCVIQDEGVVVDVPGLGFPDGGVIDELEVARANGEPIPIHGITSFGVVERPNVVALSGRRSWSAPAPG